MTDYIPTEEDLEDIEEYNDSATMFYINPITTIAKKQFHDDRPDVHKVNIDTTGVYCNNVDQHWEIWLVDKDLSGNIINRTKIGISDYSLGNLPKEYWIQDFFESYSQVRKDVG